MDIAQVQESRRQAVARVLARRREPVTTTVRCQGTDVRYTRVEGSAYLPPEDLGQWLDDRLAAQPWTGPFCAVLLAVAESARTSERAAVAEVSGALRLSRWDQFHLFRTLGYWRDQAQISPARALMSSVMREWERLRQKRGLLDERPAEPELPELPDPPRPRQPEYESRWGNRAGMRRP